MRVAIIGLGGVGGYIAASFEKAGIDVIGFARGEHLRAIQEHGVKIIEDKNNWNVMLDAKTLEEANGYFDIVIFCVKSYDIATAYKSIQSSTDKNSILLSLANGVSNGNILRELSSATVLDGAVYILSHIEVYGSIRKKGKVFAAVFGNDTQATETLALLFEKAKLRYQTPNDIQTALWKKYIFISAFATLTTYYRCSIGCIYEKHKEEVTQLLQEIAKFAKTKGIEIENEVEKALTTASKVPYNSSTSMYLDFQNKKRVELDNLSGYVKTPLMSMLYKELLSRVND